MNAIDRFLKEDLLIIKPSVFVYINKKDRTGLQEKGISVKDGKISAYLTRLPEEVYQDFMNEHFPIRITFSKLKRIKDQIIQCVAKNIDGYDKIDYKNDSLIEKLIKKYTEYLNVCYKDHIPLNQLPHIDLYFSGGILPGFVCKVLDA